MTKRGSYVLRRNGRVILRGSYSEVLSYMCKVKGEGFTLRRERKKILPKRSKAILPPPVSSYPSLPPLHSPPVSGSWKAIEQTAVETVKPGKRVA